MGTNLSEWLDEREALLLSPYATRAADSRGREYPMEPSPLRGEFQRDRDRIIHCQSFRRLMYKTQVFLAPAGDHYRTRLTHTLEVTQIARTMARALRLNEDLTEAAALGHDLGHTPFGHAGEEALRKCYDPHFAHYRQSLRVVEKLEKDGRGLNLCWEVRDAIVNHTGSALAATPEGQLIKFADRIAYINHDIDDAIRAGILNKEDIPRHLTDVLGDTHSQRINTMVTAVVEASMDSAAIRMTPHVQAATDALRAFLFENVYLNPRAKTEEVKAKDVVCTLFDYYVGHPEKLPDRYRRRIGSEDGETVERSVADFISGMTDRYAIEVYEEKYVTRVWRGLQE
jgi:dGTPase